eukprot:6968082-Prymnesium_polylepis.1
MFGACAEHRATRSSASGDSARTQLLPCVERACPFTGLLCVGPTAHRLGTQELQGASPRPRSRTYSTVRATVRPSSWLLAG